jgi:glycosyltransferase involved in cell wall biosynthesis
MQFSIFTSTHNRAQKLERLIKSLSSQTCTSWELIVINDGSTDQTSSLLKRWIKIDNRIEVVNFTDNLGHPEALYNAGICKKLNGNFVIFLGADDWFIDSNCLSTILENIQCQTQEFWKFGFSWIHEHSLNEMQVINNLSKRVFKSNEIIQDSYPDSDFVFVYRKQYWNDFDKYFGSPDKFFSCFYDVALNNNYLEKFFNIPVVVAGWDHDNITKGKSGELYYRWAIIHRLYILKKYGGQMGVNYLSYTMRSISLHAFLPYSSFNQSLFLALKSFRLAITFTGIALVSIIGALWPLKRQSMKIRTKIQKIWTHR